MKQIPSLVISVVSNDMESTMKESSMKTAFYKCMHAQRRDIYAYYFGWHLGLESGIFVKKTWDLESYAKL